jgi:hypothetical protein
MNEYEIEYLSGRFSFIWARNIQLALRDAQARPESRGRTIVGVRRVEHRSHNSILDDCPVLTLGR